MSEYNEELEAALNSELYNLSVIRSKLYDEMEDINAQIKLYSSYKSSSRLNTFAEYKLMHGNDTDIPVEETEARIKDEGPTFTLFKMSSSNEDPLAPPPLEININHHSQSRLLKRYLESREIPAPAEDI